MEARLESWKDRPLGYAFLKLIYEKKTNLCVSADITNKEKLLEIAELLGDEICMLKVNSQALNVDACGYHRGL